VEEELEGMTTPSIDSTEAPSASVEKLQEELAGITLDPPLNGNGENPKERTPPKPTGDHIPSSFLSAILFYFLCEQKKDYLCLLRILFLFSFLQRNL
jgi:hypothetical protein